VAVVCGEIGACMDSCCQTSTCLLEDGSYAPLLQRMAMELPEGHMNRVGLHSSTNLLLLVCACSLKSFACQARQERRRCNGLSFVRTAVAAQLSPSHLRCPAELIWF